MSAEKHIPNIYSQDKTTQHSDTHAHTHTHTQTERERERKRETVCVLHRTEHLPREPFAFYCSLSLSLGFTLFILIFFRKSCCLFSHSYTVFSIKKEKNLLYAERERERAEKHEKYVGDEVKKWRNNGYINDGWAAHYAQQQCHC